MNARVLVVEDDSGVRSLLREVLARRGWTVDDAQSATEAREMLAEQRHQVVVLDLGLPDQDGLEVLRDLRISSRVPVLVLTARRDEVERVHGLELGADDYVLKPFSPRELVARVEALLRRSVWRDQEAAGSAEPNTVADLEIDLAARLVRRGGMPVPLTRTELRVVVALARRPGLVWSREQLIQEVWDGAYVDDRGVDAVISRIRRKLGNRPDGSSWIRTAHGFGYAFEPIR